MTSFVDVAVADAEVVNLEPTYLCGIRGHVSVVVLHSFSQRMLPVVTQGLRWAGIEPSGPPVCLLRSGGGRTFEVTAAYPTAEPLRIGAPFITTRVPGGPAVRALHLGSRRTLLTTYDRLSEWLAAHRVTSVSLMWEEYLAGPGPVADAAAWRTRIVVPLPPGAALAGPPRRQAPPSTGETP